jgi:polyribonucleotide 5'-hydroxyl-kinase
MKLLKLGPLQELRIEFTHPYTLTITTGSAELFGSELGLGVKYKFTSPRKLAIFSWSGCTIQSGPCTDSPDDPDLVEYVSTDSKAMPAFLNSHMVFEKLRTGATGPRIMVLGEADRGKTSLCKILLNYAVKSSRTPLYVDLDTQEVSMLPSNESRVLSVYQGHCQRR